MRVAFPSQPASRDALFSLVPSRVSMRLRRNKRPQFRMAQLRTVQHSLTDDTRSDLHLRFHASGRKLQALWEVSLRVARPRDLTALVNVFETVQSMDLRQVRTISLCDQGRPSSEGDKFTDNGVEGWSLGVGEHNACYESWNAG